MIVYDLDYLTGIGWQVCARKAGGGRFSSSANALAIAQTRTGGLPVKEEYSLALTAVATGPGYASSLARSEAGILA